MNTMIYDFPVKDPKAFAAELVERINAEMEIMNHESLITWQDFRCIDWSEAVLMELHELIANGLYFDRKMEARYYSTFERKIISDWLSRNASELMGSAKMNEDMKRRHIEPYVLKDEGL